MKIGINATSVRSTGGLEHLQKIIENFNNTKNITKLTIWTSKEAYNLLKRNKKNSKIDIIQLNFDSIFIAHIYLFFLVLKSDINIFYSLNGISLSKNSIIFYQNLLPFDDYEILRNGFSIKTFKFFLLRALYKISFYYSKGRIYLNTYNKNIIEKKIGIKDKNYQIIPHGISNKFFTINKNIKSNNNSISLLYVSNFEIYKNHEEVLLAYIKYLKLNNNKQINIIFAGRFIDEVVKFRILELRKIINNYPNGNLVIINFSDRKKIISLMNSANGIIFASSCESFGFPVLEAMAMKKTLLCSNLSGLRIFTQKKAIYFDPFKVESILNSIKKFAKLNKNKCIYKLSEYNWKLITKNTFKSVIKLYKRKNPAKNIKDKIKKIFNYSFRNSYLLNYYLLNIIFINAYLYKQFLFVNDYLYIVSFCLLLSTSFSGNNKNILLKNFRNKIFYSILNMRVTISILIILLSIIFFYLYLKKDFFIVFLTSLLASIIWIYDILLINLEKKRRYNLIKKYIFFSIIILIIFNFFLLLKYFDNFLILLYLFNALFLIKIIYIYYNILKNPKFFLNYDEYKFLLSLKFYSSYLINLSNFILRFFILGSFSFKDSANIILGLSIMSIPQTIVANAIGPTYISSKKCLPIYFNFLIVIYLFGGLYFIFSNLLFELYRPLSEFDLLLIAPIYFFLGIFFYFSQIIRQIKLFNSNENVIYKNDIISSLILIAGTLFIFTIDKYLFFYFLILFSFFSLFIYMKRY